MKETTGPDPHLDGAVKTPYVSRDRRDVGTVNFIHCRQLLCGILLSIVGVDKVLKYISKFYVR